MPTPFKPTDLHSNNYPYLEGDSSFGFSDIKNQFSDTGPASLSEYYKGGSLVSESDGNLIINSGISGSTSVPSSGKISLSDLMIRPYFDVVYTVASYQQTTTSDYTYTIPQNCAFSYMKIFIQGSGASGHVGPWNWSGRGGIAASHITAPAGGNGGDYAQTHWIPITGGDVLTIKVGNGGYPPNGSPNDGQWGFQGVNGNASSGGTSYVYKNGSNVLTVGGALKSTNYIRSAAVDSGTKSVETHGYFNSGYANGPGTGNRVTIYDNSKLDLHYAGGWGGTSYLTSCLTNNAATLTASPSFNYNSSRYGGGGAPGYQSYFGTPLVEGQTHDIRGRGWGWRVSYSDWIQEVPTVTHGGALNSAGNGFDEIFNRVSEKTTYPLGYGRGGAGTKGTSVGDKIRGGPGMVRIMFNSLPSTLTSGITHNRTKARFAG
jgi:hypothetical protein|tara:strand:+ start:3168 stop:4460 length:1293 start_codon:yes stop_codon:yes gene_type:complete